VSMMQGLEGLTGKRVELLKDALPAATRIGLLFVPDNPTTVRSLAQAQEVAGRLGFVIRPFPVRSDEPRRSSAPLPGRASTVSTSSQSNPSQATPGKPESFR